MDTFNVRNMATRNPFIISGRIPDEFFCDRVDESRYLINKIEGQASNILLMANRRIGKTGLIDFCFRRPEIDGEFYTFYFDILHTSSLQEFVFEFGKEVYSRLIPKGQKLMQTLLQTVRSLNPKFSIDPFTGAPSFSLEIGSVSNPEYTLDEILKWLENADRPCVVAIDEFQRIGRYPEKNVEALLRGKIQHMDNCHFIFSGSEPHLLAEMFQSSKRPFYRSTSTMELLAIEPEKYRAFAAYWFREGGRRLREEAFDAIYQYFEGNTFCIQQLLHEAYDRTDKGDICDRVVLTECLRNILANNSNAYREMLSRLTTKQKAVLTAIAIEGNASKITSAAFLKRHQLESASMVQTALRILKGQEWVSVRDNVYCLSDQLFSVWLRQQHGAEVTSFTFF